MSKFSEQTKASEIPAPAYEFEFKGQVAFTDKARNKISLILYDGGVTKGHWFWGNMAFDLAGMSLSKNKVPILFEHSTEKRLGYSTGATFDGRFELKGELLDSERVNELKADAKGGFPFESSLKFDPRTTVPKFIAEGATAEVNGHTLDGPGTVFTKTVVMEGSVCVFGAMQNTTAQFKRTDPPAGDAAAAAFKADHPEAFALAEQSGDSKVRAMFASFVEKFAGEPAFVIEQFGKGATLISATEAFAEKMKAELAELRQNGGKVERPSVDPAFAEFSDLQAMPKDGDGGDQGEFSTFSGGDPAIEKKGLAAFEKAKAEGRARIS